MEVFPSLVDKEFAVPIFISSFPLRYLLWLGGDKLLLASYPGYPLDFGGGVCVKFHDLTHKKL